MEMTLCIGWRIEEATKETATWGNALREIDLPCIPPLGMTVQATDSIWGDIVEIRYDVQDGGIWVEILLEDSEEENSITTDIVRELKEAGWDIDYLHEPGPKPRLKLVKK